MNADEYEVDGSLRIPRVSCTENAFFQYLPHLKIRELLCWALRTETDVRLAKIKGRLGQKSSQDNDDEEDYTYSRVLKSNYLIDLYPEEGSSKKQDLSARGYDEYLFSRKAHSQIEFIFHHGMDDNNFDGLTPIQIEKKEKEKSGKKRPHSSHQNDSGKDEDLIFASDDDSEAGDHKKAANKMTMHVIPPTLLHFQIVLEAYTGYNLGASSTSSSCYNSPDTSVPRAAIMGGAVVAALTSFQDEVVVQAFASSGIFTKKGNLKGGDSYFEAKQALIKRLHTHFLYQKRESKEWIPTPSSEGTFNIYKYKLIKRDGPLRSVYSKGDADIFLQASPLTQALMNLFEEHGIGDDEITAIGSFIGTSGRNSISAGDFERFADIVMGTNGKIKAPDDTSFAFAASKHAASFILGMDDEDDGWRLSNYEKDQKPNFKEVTWPRTSQFIMLDTKADLLGGLLDFDQSIAACAFDGLSVRVAPRAALSLMTNSNFVTPFCLEEHRNKRRVIKYSKRGFKPFLVDPYDVRPTQNVACDAIITRKPFLPRGNCEYSSGYQTLSGEDRDEVLDTQERKVDEGGEQVFCCHRHPMEQMFYEEDDEEDDDSSDARLEHSGGKGEESKYLYEPGDLAGGTHAVCVMYTIKLFERSPGDAIDFFSKRFNWSAQDMRLVNEIDPHLRMACQKCKQDYNLIRIVMANHPDLLKEYELEDDILHGQFAYSSSNGQKDHVHFQPSFYSGGVFDSTHVRDNARRTLKIYAMLFSQSVFELSAYVMKHGSTEGYKKRFVFENVFECGDYDAISNSSINSEEEEPDVQSNLIRTLRKAQRTMLQEPARPPIGLNPERFIEKCGRCQSWLVGNMYGSKQCRSCDS